MRWILLQFKNRVSKIQQPVLNAGFTLLETVVAIGIFLVVVSMGVTVLMGVVDAQHKAASIQSVQDNIRFSLELMTKELRTGKDFRTTPYCAADLGQEIEFISTNNTTGDSEQPRLYFLSGGKIMRNKTLLDLNDSNRCDQAVPLTGEDVLVESLKFLLRGEQPADPTKANDGQARITISMKVRGSDARFGAQTSMILQTTVVPRLRDL